MKNVPTPNVASPRSTGADAEFRRAVEVEKLEAMAEFAAGAGHEINNPLTVISGRAQLLLQGETDPERRHALALISAQAVRVYEMIADMMLFARPPRPEWTRCELTGLTAAVVAELTPAADRQETVLTYTPPSAPLEIDADPAQVTVALRAVCQNAFEALDTGGHVVVEVATMDAAPVNPAAKAPAAAPGLQTDMVQIRVSDDGPGITPEQRRHIFDPFYSARQAGRGLGLGLSKAWRIAAQHGGRVDVSSQAGQGTTVAIILPRARAETPTALESAAVSAPPLPGARP